MHENGNQECMFYIDKIVDLLCDFFIFFFRGFLVRACLIIQNEESSENMHRNTMRLICVVMLNIRTCIQKKRRLLFNGNRSKYTRPVVHSST